MTRPLIGIPCSVRLNEGAPPLYQANQAYCAALALSGGAPVLIPSIDDLDALRALFDSLDGLLLPGGADIGPSIYGARPHPRLGAVDSARDRAELALAQWALAEQKPVLGICRGQQLLNVASGGTLFQDIPSEIPRALRHRVEQRNAMAHTIDVEPDSRLADLLGTTRTMVNSLHHQALRDLAHGWQLTAQAPDGVIEGIERLDHRFAVAVQFHPEELVPGHEASERLLQRFVTEAAAGR